MPVPAKDTEIVHAANGVTTVFAFPFMAQRAEDVAVAFDGVVVSVDYTIAGAGSPSGGTVTFTLASRPLNGVEVLIFLDVDYERSLVDYQPNGEFAADTVDFDVDRVVMMTQQIATALKRTPQLPRGSALGGVTLTPDPLKLLGWNGAGDGIVNVDPATLAPGTITVTPYAQTLLAAADDVAARTLLREASLLTQAAINTTLSVTTAGSGALTVALKGNDGNNHSAANIGYVPTRAFAAGGGGVDVHALSAPLALTIPKDATLGTYDGVSFRVWVALFSNVGVPVLGVIMPRELDTASPRNASLSSVVRSGLASATAISASATSAKVWYWAGPGSLSSRPYTLLGWFEYNGGLSAAGNYISNPNGIASWVAGMPTPGEVVQIAHGGISTYVSGTATVALDDVVPGTPSSWGTLIVSGQVTSAPRRANVLRIRASAPVTHSAANANIIGLVHAGTDVLAMGYGGRYSAINNRDHLAFDTLIAVVGGASTTYSFRMGSNVAGTMAANGLSAREYGGALGSHLIVEELMA